MSEKIRTGNAGEKQAAAYLEGKGFEIIARNYRYRHAEIDLIAKKENLLVFVEVKTRRSSRFGEPESFVTSRKIAKIFEGAEQYIYETNWHGNIRFDIVSIKTGILAEIVHFEDAFH